MPASRRALAMILAPRSCPSRPGFAITTRIFRATMGKYMNVKLTIVGCSPAWPNPGGAQSGYLVEGSQRVLLDCGPGVLPRLRQQENWPIVDAIAITHFHLDHWGDLVPWTWGSQYGPGRNAPRVELWLPPGGREALRHFGTHFGNETMFEEAFELREYTGAQTFETAGLKITPMRVPHY